jgi:hypothetical protein
MDLDDPADVRPAIIISPEMFHTEFNTYDRLINFNGEFWQIHDMLSWIPDMPAAGSSPPYGLKEFSFKHYVEEKAFLIYCIYRYQDPLAYTQTEVKAPNFSDIYTDAMVQIDGHHNDKVGVIGCGYGCAETYRGAIRDAQPGEFCAVSLITENCPDIGTDIGAAPEKAQLGPWLSSLKTELEAAGTVVTEVSDWTNLDPALGEMDWTALPNFEKTIGWMLPILTE